LVEIWLEDCAYGSRTLDQELDPGSFEAARLAAALALATALAALRRRCTIC